MSDFQLKRGTAAAVASYTGPLREIVVDHDNMVMALQDGVTAGGHPVGAHFSIQAPSIISPLDGANHVGNQPTIQTSAFSGHGNHIASRYQVSDDPLFSHIVHDSGRETANLTSYSLANIGVTLDVGAFYLRVKHESDAVGESQWSTTVSFSVPIQPGAVIDGDVVIGPIGSDWLLVAPPSKRATSRYGLDAIDITEVFATYVESNIDPKTGKENTDILTSEPYLSMVDRNGIIGSPAANYCRAMGYDLPNKEELLLMLDHEDVIAASEPKDGPKTMEYFNSSSYPQRAIGSTQFSTTSCWSIGFYYSSTSTEIRASNQQVIPVRRLPV